MNFVLIRTAPLPSFQHRSVHYGATNFVFHKINNSFPLFEKENINLLGQRKNYALKNRITSGFYVPKNCLESIFEKTIRKVVNYKGITPNPFLLPVLGRKIVVK